MASTDTNAIAKIDPSQFLVLGDRAEEAKTAVDLVMRGGLSDKKLNRIRIPAAGGKSWEINTLEGTISTPTFSGVIVYSRGSRAWWEKSYEESGGGILPDCYSLQDDEDTNLAMGKAKLDETTGKKLGPGMRCAVCPYNKWKSAPKGNGKACQERNRLYIVRPDSPLPDLLSLPPTSLGNAEEFFISLVRGMTPPQAVIATFSLEQDKGGPSGTMSYSKAVIKVESVLKGKDREKFAGISGFFKGAIIDASKQNAAEDVAEDWRESEAA